jgi:glycerophosphoryl diester phosphodiesterase
MRNSLLLFFSIMMFKMQASGQKRIDMQGHRGSRGLMPENTIPAMIKAIDLGVTTLELDVVISKDLKVVVSHEPFMNPEISTAPEGFMNFNKDSKPNIFQMNYDEIKQWDVGLKINERFPEQRKIAIHKPLLEELIDSVEQYVASNNLRMVKYNIETKLTRSTDGIFHPGPVQFVELLMKVLQKKNMVDKVIIQSFDKRTIQLVHEQFPGVKTSYLIGGKEMESIPKIINDLGFVPDIISPEFNLVDKNLIVECHKKGIQVVAWTVNSREKIKELVQMGIDGIISDYPDMFDVIL